MIEARKLAQQIRAAGINVRGVYQGDDVTDDEIDIDDRTHVQVNPIMRNEFAVVTETDPGAFSFVDCSSASEVISALRAV